MEERPGTLHAAGHRARSVHRDRPHGYAIAASTSDEAELSVTSAQVQEATAESLDGSSTTVKNPDNLADLRDEDVHLRETARRINRHRQALGVGPGLRPEDRRRRRPRVLRPHGAAHPGPPPGQTFQVSIPGFYSSSQTLTSAAVEYAEQFATYIPPDQASPQILADASGITGRE